MTLRRLDLVLTIAMALVVGVLGAFDVVDTTVTGGATLATLGLLAVSSLHGRSTLATLDRSVAELGRTLSARSGADQLLGPSTSGIDLDLGAADDIRILGVTLARTVRNHYAILCRRLEEGATVRIALIASAPSTIAEAARRSTMADSPEVFEHRLRPTMDLLDDLAVRAASGPGRLEVRLLDFVPAFGLVALDPEQPRGQVHIDVYSHRSGIPEPTLPLHADRDARWFRHFITEFDQVWACGHPHAPGSAGDVAARRGEHPHGSRRHPAAATGPQPAPDGGDGSPRLAPGELGAGGRGQRQSAGDTAVHHHNGAHAMPPQL
ncbi:hypothetical protein [Actinoplanes sp. RD1]|uniref:hypothetical protein n=1 Tax=Actinoplanes sp. RD1 TaxID=3064538 RepID=UPI00274248E5|nr:hypothetical protein [Actinoplanes sp. RD1]